MKKIKRIIPPCRECVFNPKKYVKTPDNPCPQCKRDGYSSCCYELTGGIVKPLSEKEMDIILKKHPLEDFFSEALSVYGSMGSVVIGGRSYDIATTVEWGASPVFLYDTFVDIDGVEHYVSCDTRPCFPPEADTDEELKKFAQLTNLTKLHLDDNHISDVTPLAQLTQLTNFRELYLGDNQISDIAPLAQLTNLKVLALSDNQISDIAPLAKLTNLRGLYLGDNQISDITPLAKLTNLRWLNLRDNQISDITPLAKLTNLTNLQLSYDKINYKQIEKLKVRLPNTFILL